MAPQLPSQASQPLANRVAVVTGATGGLGASICRTLAVAGAQVVVAYHRHAEAAHALVRELGGELGGDGHLAIQVDVTSSASLARLAAATADRYGTVDLLVNGVGTTRFVPHRDLDALDDDLIDQIFKTNWRGPFATIRALHPLLANRDGGLIVNISSIAAVSGIGSNIAYCASKAALNAMTISLARVLAPAVRVVSISPGLVDTDFIKGLDPAWRDEQVARTPLGRLASPEDIGRAVIAVATTLAYSTGCIIPVDGGRLLS